MLAEKLPCVEINPPATPIASIIWLHGLGADGHDFASIVPELHLAKEFPIRFVFPHAPMIPVTINNGHVMRAWYDILGLTATTREDKIGIRQSQAAIHTLIEYEKSLGIPANRIIVAGFSQGGAMALHTGLRYPERLAGILALSTYLPLASSLKAEATAANNDLPIFLAHGMQDNVVPYTFAQISQQALQYNGHTIEFHTYPMAHSVCMEELADIAAWLRKILK